MFNTSLGVRKMRSSSKVSIHRILTTRLAIVGLIISLVLGVSVLLIERSKVGEVVLDRALQAAAHFNAEAGSYLDKPGLPDHQGIQRVLDAFVSRGVKLRNSRYGRVGYSVIVNIFDLDRNKVAKYIDNNYADIEAVETHMDSSELRIPRDDDDLYEIIRIHGNPYIKFGMPLTNSSGDVVAYVEGVFAVSSEAIADVRRRAIRVALAVIAIVLVTTGLLYPVIIKLISKLTRLNYKLLDSQLETLKVLGGAIATRDNDTDAHNYRVTIFSVRLAEAAGLDHKNIRTLIKGAFLHDVGKIGITDNILLKPGNLTDSEFKIMKSHVTQGLNIIERSEWLKDAAEVVGCHHEKVDGNGYLKGLNGGEIPVTARIFSIADVFDALSSRRPYKEPFSFRETMKIIEEKRGSHFDPTLVDIFTNIAKSLFDGIAGRDGNELKDEVDTIIQKYFSRDINTIFD
jgi:HD-GYP domain-containing protein (c-di-GMP phosphodiesterase class II)